MLFNQIVLQEMVDTVYQEMKDHEKVKDYQVDIPSDEPNVFIFTIEEEEYVFTINYAFHKHLFLFSCINGWDFEKVAPGIYLLFVQTLVKEIEKRDLNCFLWVDHAYHVAEAYRHHEWMKMFEEECLVFGEKTKALVRFINDQNLPLSWDVEGMYLRETTLEDCTFHVRLDIKNQALRVIAESSETYQEPGERDEAYVLYVLDSPQACEAYLHELQEHKQFKEDVLEALTQFIQKKENVTRKGRMIQLVESRHDIYIRRILYENRISYEVKGFEYSKVLSNKEEVLPFLVETYQDYTEWKETKTAIFEMIKKEDDYAFRLESPMWRGEEAYDFYSGILDRKYTIEVRYLPHLDKRYWLQLCDKTNKSYESRGESVWTAEAQTKEEAVNLFYEEYKKMLNPVRLTVLFDPKHKKHFYKMYHVLGIKNWDNITKVSSLSFEEINQSLETYFSTHPLKSLRERQHHFHVFGDLLVYRDEKYLLIYKDVEEFQCKLRPYLNIS